MTDTGHKPAAAAHDRRHDDPQVRAEAQHDHVRRVDTSPLSSTARPIPPASKTYAAISFIWRRAAPAFLPSTKASRHCGSFSTSPLGALTSSTIPSLSTCHANFRSS